MPWEYSPKEFIKLYRKFIRWEWYKDPITKSVFLHCILRANWKAGSWRGIQYEAGEFITSLPALAEETGLSIQQVRTALSHLTSTGEVTDRTTDRVTGKKLPKCRVIKLNNWTLYQATNREANRESNSELTGNQQGVNRELTGNQQQNKNIKNIKENKERKEIYAPPAESPSGDDDFDEGKMIDFSNMTDEEIERLAKYGHL